MNLCTLHQWLWSCATEEGRALPGLTRQHLQHCTRCREMVASMQQVSAKLIVEQSEPDEGWHANVMQAIRRAAPPATCSPAHWALPVSLAAAAAVCVAAFLLRPEPQPKFGDDPLPARQIASSFVVAAGEVAGSLEYERAALQEDLQQALQIATSCLPF